MPDAARISDFHACPKVEPGPIPHVGGPVFTGSSNVIIGYLPAARVDDRVVCFPVGPTDKIQRGSTTVLINHRAAARRADPCAHGGRIVVGCPTVIVGDNPQSFTLRAAAKRGTPFCEECERKRREMDDHDDSATSPPDTDTASLDDATFPPGALAAQDPASGTELTPEQLAKEPNKDDGLDALRKAARYSVANQFYINHTTIDPYKRWSHLGGIDVNKPVEVVDVAKQTLYQRGIPGGSTGQYFARDANAVPDQGGISEHVFAIQGGKQVPPPVPRDSRVIQLGDPALALASTAASVLDTWSMPGHPVPCSGGGGQLMVPAKFHPAATITIL